MRQDRRNVPRADRGRHVRFAVAARRLGPSEGHSQGRQQVRGQRRRKVAPAFKARKDFNSDDDYGRYIKETLAIGARIRALVGYEKIKKGMRGTYFGTNEGTPPCLVMWDDDLKSGSVLLENFPKQKASHAYWIYWHQVDLQLD